MGKNYNILDTNLILSGLIKNMKKQLQALEEVHFNNKKNFQPITTPFLKLLINSLTVILEFFINHIKLVRGYYLVLFFHLTT